MSITVVAMVMVMVQVTGPHAYIAVFKAPTEMEVYHVHYQGSDAGPDGQIFSSR